MHKWDIIELRNKLNMSQETFARELGVSLMTVNHWENGHRNPGPQSRRKLGALAKRESK